MAATLSLSTHHPTPPFSPHQHHRHHRLSFPIHITSSTSRIPSTPPPNSSSSSSSSNSTTIPLANLYQPFRPPTTPLPPKYLSLSPEDRLDVLRNRLGLWHHYAPLITSLGLTPSSINDITGITPIEQNLLAVASKVRDSLIASSSHLLPFFDSDSGADLLYALRLLNSRQRAAAAAYFAENRVDSKELAEEVARAVKEFPRRRGEKGWECFSPDSPPDCLAYTYFRFSREAISDGDRNSALEKALGLTVTERARKRIVEEMQKNVGGEGYKVVEEEELVELAAVPVVKLRYGEVSEATSVVVLPVCRAAEGIGELEAAPRECKLEGGLGVVRADRGWGRWVVLPGWGPAALVAENGGLAVEFGDGRVLPWRKYRWGKEETVLVVVDRRRNAVEGDGYYLVEGGNGEEGLTVERGRKVLESGRTDAIGAVVLVVRPPVEEDGDRLRDEDWE